MHIVPSQNSFYLLIALAAALVAAAWDVKTRRIPNWLTASSILIGLAVHCAFGGIHGMLVALAAALVGGGIFVIFFLAGGMGAGDVKLMAAVAAIVSFHSLFQIMVTTALMGGIFALCLAAAHGKLKQTAQNIKLLFVHHRYQGLTPHPDLNIANRKTLRLPYAIAIAAGCLITFIGDMPPR
jgi:prepilin peptidase CpaA